MSKAFGIINFAGNNIQVNDMQAYRPIGAFSFLGRYRVIDFPISNMSHSGIDVMQVYIRRKPRSLVEHLGTGRHYNINSKRGKLVTRIQTAVKSVANSQDIDLVVDANAVAYNSSDVKDITADVLKQVK